MLSTFSFLVNKERLKVKELWVALPFPFSHAIIFIISGWLTQGSDKLRKG